MSKKMLINASHPEENRVAIVVDGILSELDIEIAGQEQSKGNIYKAVVIRVETGLQAAFVDYGAEKLGFLQIGEIHPKLYPARNENKGHARIAEVLQRGQEILVQIVKEERGNKGAALTTFLSIPGRYMVLMPDSTTKGVSRKISLESERKNLKKTMAELDLPERMGYIVRTAGIGKDKEELKRDFNYLVRLFEGIVARKDQVKAPAQLYQESNLAIRSIRDYFSTEMDEVLVDDPKVFEDTRDFFSLVMPELKHLVKRHRERRPIFSRYQIEEQIEGLVKNQAPLPSGGSIVLDQTEALVAIDVNSGKMSGESGIEATAYKTNLEAAAEIGRQLRLRDLGGLIVIDFIDMRDRKNIRDIEQEVRKALKDDKAKVSVGRISQFGLLELSRQRLKPVLSVGAYIDCPHCKGIGRVKSTEAQAVAFLRQAHTAAAKGQVGHIEANVPLEVANYLLNQKRATIIELERQLQLRISLLGRSDLLPGELELVIHKREIEQEHSQQSMPVSHDNQIEIALAAAQQEVQEQETAKQIEGESASESADPAAEQEHPEDPAEKNKKRRRRRRKKPVTTSQETAPSDQQEQNEETPAEQIQIEQISQPEIAVAADNRQIAPVQDETSLQNGEDGQKEKAKPKRRPRRKPNKATEPPANPAVTALEVKIVAEEAPREPQVASATEIIAETKPNPRRASGRGAKKATDKPATVSATAAAAAEEKPKQRSRRTPSRTPKVETAALTPAPSLEVSAIEAKTAEKEAPKRRPRRATAKKKEAAAEVPAE